ncbi:hypothetical protein PVAND_005667 [Polypedilum vanderplanki]|uniref:alpha-glucosidase n=1 Tax=Polypedilum vanderplanki TaxID=319348 RepID=A0A9J6C0R0_POLVA|nr:hypothetical protein PVAND_005667 [Polypedilum vanderplanki]
MELLKSLFILFTFIAIAVHSQLTDESWWKTANIYQISPLSFKDSDDDGKGDIKGIISKLDYFVETGINVLLITPFFETNMVDFAYDVTNYVKVDETFGTMSDIEELFAKAKEKNLRIILDFVPNHTSNRHEWFLNSEISVSEYENFYVWHDGIPQKNDGQPLPPNNWTSEYGGSSWKWNAMREAYYYHKFAEAQPDLNLREEKVIQKLNEVLKFWIDKGADGFRINAVSQLFEDAAFLEKSDIEINLPQTYELIERWRALIDEYSSGKVLIPQVWNSPIADLMRYYQNDDGSKQRAQIPMNFMLINELTATSNASEFKRVIESYTSALPEGAIANWLLGSHDHNRVASRMGKEKIDGLMILLQTLPGISFNFYGDEIGMEDYMDISWEDTMDIQACNADQNDFKRFSRDVARTPFQWDNSTNAGFSSGKPWLPVNPSYIENNLDAQIKTNRSHYKLFKELLVLRKNETFIKGDLNIQALNTNVLGYSRSYNGNSFIIAINLNNTHETVDASVLNVKFGDESEIYLASSDSSYNSGDIVNVKNLHLMPYDAVIIKYSSATKITLSLLTAMMMIVKIFL